MTRSRQKYVWAALIILALVAGFAWFALGFVRPSVGYTICSEFASMPEGDEALEQWLRGQRDVVSAHIKREGQRLEVFYLISRDFRRKLPDVQGQCHTLGYTGQVAPFRDCDR